MSEVSDASVFWRLEPSGYVKNWFCFLATCTQGWNLRASAALNLKRK